MFRKALAVAAAVLCCLITPSLLAQSEDFTVIALPDTQFYSESYPHIFRAQTQWIADNRDSRNIKFVVGLGDIVNDGSSVTQWETADQAIRTLDAAGIPYILPPGNHDYKWSRPDTRDLTLFNSYFGKTRYSSLPTYLEGYPSGTNNNSASRFSAGGRTYLVLALEFHPSDAALNWAEGVVASNPDARVIVTTHSYMFNDNFRIGRCDWNTAEAFGVGADNDGDEMWDKFVSRHPNIFLVLSGHITRTGRRSDLGVNGNLVNQILADYQSDAEGGGGYLRILKFRPSLNLVEVSTYSPYYGQYKTDPANQFTVNITAPANYSTTGFFEGKVRKAADCSLVSGATVATSGASYTSDAYGKFWLNGLSPGSYSVQASKSGYQASSSSGTIRAGYGTAMKFFLDPSTSSGACQLDPTSPSVTICQPADGASVSSPVRIVAGTTSNYAITVLQIYVDGAKVYEVNTGSLDTSLTLTPGNRRITVQARDASGTWFKKTVYVDVADPTPPPSGCTINQADPSITICTPANGATVASPVEVKATLNSTQALTILQLYVDGAKVYEVASKSLSTSVTLSAGKHRVTVQAILKDKSVVKQSIHVTVSP
jgi:hypothetical protein